MSDRNGTVSHRIPGDAGPPKRTTLRLSQARADTPPPDPVQAVKQSLVMSLYAQIGEEDVAAIAGKIVEEARAGDKQARKLLLDLVTRSGGGQAQPQVIERPVFVEAGAKQLRLLCAYAIRVNGAMPVEALARLTGLSDSDTAGLLEGCWFETSSKGVGLSIEGRQQVG